MMRHVLLCLVALAFCVGVCSAERAQVVGTVSDARSGVPVTVHPVTVEQDAKTLARDFTDRLGKFKLEFNYKPGAPLLIKTGSTTGYLEAQGTVDADTEVLVKVMPRWATILGIVTDRVTGRGLGDIPVSAGRGETPLHEHWASTSTDATGVFMLKAPAFDGDDVTKPVRDLWLAVNAGETAAEGRAVVHTDTIPLWAWPDPTQPTKVEVALPPADAQGLTVADVVSIMVPDALKPREPVAPPAAPAGPTGASPSPELKPGEFIYTDPATGRRYRITIVALD